MRFACAGFASLIFVVSAHAQNSPIAETTLRGAAGKTFQLVQKSQDAFYKKDACVSCHHQIFPVMVESVAHERGIPFDAKFAAEVTKKTFSPFKDLDGIVQGHFYIDDIGDAWELLAAHAAGVPPSLATSAMAQAVAGTQRTDGGWRTMDSRPPQSHGRFTTTAVCVRAVQLYLPESHKRQKDAVVEKARGWLSKATPNTTEERTYQLLGLYWSGADEAIRTKAAKALLGQQREDGGWGQTADLKSDAYSTGVALYALHVAAGLDVKDATYQRGLQYLIKTQEADGSWKVESRLHPTVRVSPDYFDAKFPHGRRHQFVSIMGTSWSAMAIMQALPRPAGVKIDRPALPDFAPAEKEEWIRIALSGSAAELKAALDKGMKPNAKTAKGTTALMLAAHDAEKVQLLIARGADVHARSDAGYTALMVAARKHGNSEVVRSLLKNGAKANADKNVKVLHNASPLAFAAFSGDVESARALLDAGAMIEPPMIVLGILPIRPLMAAVQRDDVAMAELLLAHKADPNGGEIGTPLGRAAVNNQLDVARVLLAKGAKVNLVDPLGMTPLHYAASVPHNNTALVEALLAAGADRNAKDMVGRTALELARTYNHAAVAKALEAK